MSSSLESLLEKIDNERDRHLKVGKSMLEADDSKLFALDLLAVAALNRSLSNCSAFTQLARSRNYLVSAALVRLQLDTFLRFFASYLVASPHDFASAVLAGTEVRKIKDRSGALMTDRHLAESAAPSFPWVPSVYKATSGFIHLSDKHIFGAIERVQDDGALSMLIGSGSDRFPAELWTEMTEGFIAATDALFQYLEGWTSTKANPELAQAAKERK
ncbi:hypothetical protein [Pseudoxanthomonas sp.]|uniref:hypothetical protein n=1 Tax=Pseudoxanthomonas sp. TaxID=1871049 RepID=UPI0035B0C580